MENYANKETTCVATSFTENELNLLKEARKKKIVFDGDCPETTPEQAMKFRRVNPLKTIAGK